MEDRFLIPFGGVGAMFLADDKGARRTSSCGVKVQRKRERKIEAILAAERERETDCPTGRQGTVNGASAPFYKPSHDPKEIMLSLHPKLSDDHGPTVHNSTTVAKTPRSTLVFQTTFVPREKRVTHRHHSRSPPPPPLSVYFESRNQFAAGVARFDAPF